MPHVKSGEICQNIALEKEDALRLHDFMCE